MNYLYASLFDWLARNPLLAIVLMIGIQATLLWTLAAFIAYRCEPSAKHKHQVWVSVIFILLAMIPMYACLPGWMGAKITIATRGSSIDSTTEQTSLPRIPSATLNSNTELSAIQEPSDNGPIVSTAAVIAVESPPPTNLIADGPTLSGIESDGLDTTVASQSFEPSDRDFKEIRESANTFSLDDWMKLAGVIYLLVVSFLLSRFFFGWRRLVAMSKIGLPLDASSLEIAHKLLASLAMQRTPKMVRSIQVNSPMSWGMFRQEILLPISFDRWSVECRRAVLAHEMVHVFRRDSRMDLVGRLCSIIYWCHPVAHWIDRSRVNAREDATDEHVLQCGISPTEYARQLLEVAERCAMGPRTTLPAVSMAASSQIESRIRRILAYQGDQKTAWSFGARFALSVFMLLLFVVCLPIRIQPSLGNNFPTASFVPATQEEPKSASLFERMKALKPFQTTDSTATTSIKVEGTVLTPQGTPSAVTIVACWIFKSGSDPTVVGKGTTDSNGRYGFEIEYPTDLLHLTSESEYARESQFLDKLSSPAAPKFRVVAVDSQNQISWLNLVEDHLAKSIDMQLLEMTGRIQGTLLAPGDKPLSGVRIRVYGLHSAMENERTGDEFDLFRFASVSDEKGHFVIDGLPSKRYVFCIIDSPDWIAVPAYFATSASMPPFKLAGSQLLTLQSPLSLKLFPTKRISGSIVDSDGRPISGAIIGDYFGLIRGQSFSNSDGSFTANVKDLSAWGASEAPTDIPNSLTVVGPPNGVFFPTSYKVLPSEIHSGAIPPIHLEKGEWVRGKVLATIDKKPIANVRIETKYPKSGKRYTATSDEDGRFQLFIRPGQLELTFVPSWVDSSETIRFLTETKRATRPVDLLPGEPVDLGSVLLDVVREPKVARIRVVEPDGTSAAGYEVQLFPKTDNISAGRQSQVSPSSLLVGNQSKPFVVTDQNGMCDVKPVLDWAKTNVLVARSSEINSKYFGLLELDRNFDKVQEWKLEKAIEVVGKVTLNDLPLEGATITASMGNSPPFPLSTYPPLGRAIVSLPTDEEGKYVLHVPKSNGMFTAGISKLTGKWAKGFAWEGGFNLIKIKPSIQGDEKQPVVEGPTIELKFGEGEIAGKVVDEKGAPIAGASIQMNLSNVVRVFSFNDPTRWITAEDGTFLLRNFPSGKYSFRVTEGDQSHLPIKERKNRRSMTFEAKTGDKDVLVQFPSREKSPRIPRPAQ